MTIRQFLNMGLDFSQKLHFHHSKPAARDHPIFWSNLRVLSHRGEAYLSRFSQENARFPEGAGASGAAQRNTQRVRYMSCFPESFVLRSE